MKAVVVQPGSPETLGLAERDEPSPDGALVVEAVAVGVCGTDHEIIGRGHGVPPDGAIDLVLGHESLGRVVHAPSECGLSAGDLVVGVVRRPDPVPCSACAQKRWDMCLNGGYSERGIKGADGYASELFVVEPEFAVPVPQDLGLNGVLVEPASIVTKAWRRIVDFAIMNWRPLGSVLITGAGPIGLLAALLGVQRDLEVHVLDRVEEGPKPRLVQELGARYHVDLSSCPKTDAVIECTGAPALIPLLLADTGANAVVCLTGVSEHATEEVDVGALNRELVLENDVVFGSVNAGKDDYLVAVEALAHADPSWLSRVVSRRVPLARWSEAYEPSDVDVKTVLVFDD